MDDGDGGGADGQVDDGDGWKHGGPAGGRMDGVRSEQGWTAEQSWDARKHNDAAGGKSVAGYGYGGRNC